MLTNKERLEWFVISVAALVWVVTVVVNFFKPEQNIDTATLAFGSIATVVLGTGIYNKFIRNGKNE